MSAVAAIPSDFDTRLMLQLRAGDADAFSSLLERNYQRIVGLAHRYGQDASQAEDTAQETFLRVYQARERYRPERNFSSWLFRIATNLCISGTRRRRPLRMDDSSVPPGRRPPLQDLLQDELRDTVRAAVSRLPARQQEAIRLQRFEGLRYEEIGDRLGLTVPAVKSLLHRARGSLREELAAYLG